MNNRARVIFFLFFSCFMALSSLIYTLGGNEKIAMVQVTGIVRLTGSGPVSELVITGQDGQWFIAKEDERKLKDLQHRTVTVQGAETVEELTFANGRPAGKRRILSRIKIIAIDKSK